MSLKIKKNGILDTVQDFGRVHFRASGINPNGAMDRCAMRLINILLGNDESEAVLEMHFPAAEISFESGVVFALGGANFSARLDNIELENWRTYAAEKGQTLKFAEKKAGSRIYLAVKNGFKLEKWLGSASTNLQIKTGGLNGEKLRTGDRIDFRKTFADKLSARSKAKISNSLIPFYSSFPTVRVVAGADFESLAAHSQEIFLTDSFSITNHSNRMGYRLSGRPVYLLNEGEKISSAVNFGTIQLLPDNQLIVLMADHQTTGGYPKLANIIEIDLPLAAQLGAGDKIGFHLISIREAENLTLDIQKNLNVLKTAVKFL